MAQCFRLDAGKLERLEKGPAGQARVRAHMSRSGVQRYLQPDGSFRREYRPPEEVLKADSLASWKGATVTVGHPPERVTPANWAKYSRGTVLDAATPEHSPVDAKEVYAASTVDVNHPEALAKIDSGEIVEVSAGYTCDFDGVPGKTLDGEEYDGCQRNIKINHLALLGAGRARAGRGARLLVDSDEGFRCDSDWNQLPDTGSTEKGQSQMDEFLIAGRKVKAGAELQNEIDKLTAERDTATKTAQTATDERDKARATADTAEKARKDAADKADGIEARIDEEIEFRARVAPLLADEKTPFVFKGQSRRAVKCAVIKKLTGDDMGADKSDAYVDGRFDSEMKRHDATEAERSKEGENYTPPKRDSDDRDDEKPMTHDAWEQSLKLCTIGDPVRRGKDS